MPLGLQLLGCTDLRCDDALGIARATAIDTVVGFRRRDERRHDVHVGREHDCRIGLAGPRRPNIKAIAFHVHAFDVIAQALQFVGQHFADGGFVTRDRLDVDQLASECE